MSAAPRHPLDLLPIGIRMNAEQFFALGETDERLELVDGVVRLAASPVPIHQLLLHQIQLQFGEWQRRYPQHPILVFPDTDLFLRDDLVYRPDLSVYRAERLRTIPRRLDTPPDVIVEVLSPGTKPFDLITKRDDYERLGVAEYWTFDPDDARVRAWRLEASKYVEMPTEGDLLRSRVLPGLALDLAPLKRILDR